MDMPTIGVRVHGGLSAARCVALARAAEHHGFRALWFAENPFNRGVLPAMAAAALATTRLGIGIGVFNPYNRHPTLIAMEAGALDELAGGRVALGIGSGIGTRIVQMGLSYDKPLGAVRDAVAIARGMLRGESVTHEGSVFSTDHARLEFPLLRSDMPIHVAAMGEGALRLTGEIGDGLMISNMCPPSFATHARTLMAVGAARAGRQIPATIIQYVPCIAGPDRGRARTHVKATLGAMLSAYWSLYAQWPATKAAMLKDSGIDEAEVEAAIGRLRDGAPANEALDDRFVDTYALAGDADDLRAGIANYAAAGVTELVLTFASPEPEQDMAYVAEALRRV